VDSKSRGLSLHRSANSPAIRACSCCSKSKKESGRSRTITGQAYQLGSCQHAPAFGFRSSAFQHAVFDGLSASQQMVGLARGSERPPKDAPTRRGVAPADEAELLTSEGVSLSVLTRRQRRRADQLYNTGRLSKASRDSIPGASRKASCVSSKRSAETVASARAKPSLKAPSHSSANFSGRPIARSFF
jgi:hypothetical protein